MIVGQVKEPVACSLDSDQLEGYCCACGVDDVSPVSTSSLHGRVELSKKHSYEVCLQSGKVRVDSHASSRHEMFLFAARLCHNHNPDFFML